MTMQYVRPAAMKTTYDVKTVLMGQLSSLQS